MKRQIKLILVMLVVSAIGTSALNSVVFAKDKTTIRGSISVKGKSKSEYASLAKISLQDAIVAASKGTSGKVLEAALDREDGFLVYEVEVLMPNQMKKEVLIDAGNGQVLFSQEKKFKADTEDEEDDE